MTRSEFIQLPGGDWHIWRQVVLRGAGFPVRLVEQLADSALAEPHPSAGVFAGAVERSLASLRAMADLPRLREAITWQNRAFVTTCLDRPLDRSFRASRSRAREIAIAAYVQRYATKNESIGFFGPIGWGAWLPSTRGLRVAPGAQVETCRKVYFESWAMDAVSAALSRRPELSSGLPPRVVPTVALDGGTALLPNGRSLALAPAEVRVLNLCDGRRTVREIAELLARSDEQTLSMLTSLTERGIARIDFGGPLEIHAERRLQARLARVPDPVARSTALADVATLLAARDLVAEARGRPAALHAALDDLDARFSELTGADPVRSRGKTYAARTVVYEDSRRDVSLEIGGDVLTALGEPLSLVLASGRWLARQVGVAYLRRLDEYHKRRADSEGVLPLARLLALAARDFYTGRGVPDLALGAVREMQQTWAGILKPPSQARAHHLSVRDIAAHVRSAFACDPPQWACASHHSPDIMIAAESASSVARGEYLLVLGELHVAMDTVESAALVEQHDNPSQVRAMVETACGPSRVVPIMPRAWGTQSRTGQHSAIASRAFTYLALDSDDVAGVPSPPLPVAGLDVVRLGGELVVRARAGGREYPLAEVLGAHLSLVTVNAFRLLPPARHAPRITFDRLVVARETWRLPVRKCDWAHQLDEHRRWVLMREWVERHALPRRVFCSMAIETKPFYVDFTSLALVNGLAAALRRLRKAGDDQVITISEMLPDPAHSWLADATGERYVAELRTVVTDRACG